jgi:hypothetical protein
MEELTNLSIGQPGASVNPFGFIFGGKGTMSDLWNEENSLDLMWFTRFR